MAYNARPWLRRIAMASVAGMSESEISERGYQIMLDAMRAAYDARHPRVQASDIDAGGNV